MQLFLLLLFLLTHVAMVAAVAGCRSDRDKDHRPRENCTAAGFSDIPAGFEHTTKVLLFPNNLFSSLSWSSFQIFTQIHEIDLTGNKVPDVTPSAAPMLPSLSVLRLGSNRLTSLSGGSFSACPALTELYLDHNVIDSLSDRSFSGLGQLEILDLTANHIKVLPDLMLHPLPAIETLYLENNKIKVMPDDWFSQKDEVPYLYLSANPWACSCSLSYLHSYLDDHELNVYVRDGPDIKGIVESVVCDSPPRHRGRPVVGLDESDLCSPATEPDPTGVSYQPISSSPYQTTAPPTVPATTYLPPPPPPTVPATTYLPPPPPPTVPATTYLPPPPPPTVPATTYLPPPPPPTVPATTYLPPPPPTVPATTYLLTVGASTGSPTKPVLTTSTSTSVSPWASNEASGVRRGEKRPAGGAGVFCVWLLAACLLLCAASAAGVLATLVTLVRLVVWYRRVDEELARSRGGRDTLMLLSRMKEKEVAGVGGGVTALYRSVLFVHREGGEAVEGEDGGEGGVERLAGKGGGDPTREEGGGGGRGVYRKTLYRLISKEEAIEGWRDVMEECQVSAEGGGGGGGRDRRSRGGGGASKKHYSVILREEREEAGGGREELDWVVGGWEVKRGGGEGPRSSWGEWLAHYLPGMPWGVTTPREDEAAQ
ncbi:platelet glycoprotein Ib alpha chain-like [Brachyistius frenatus]|uniref:platelet glycoprotein Ib alpha chain-like n=1 Tax=Brachyistius frenatus TaxID=100188 RepID=UPI0037E8BB95